MATSNKNSICISKKLVGLFGLFGLTIVVIFALLVSNTNLLKGQLSSPQELKELIDDSKCKSLRLKTIPSPLKANQNAVIIVETDPADWKGTFIASTSSGSLGEAAGNKGSYIKTNEKVLSYSGGEANSRVTIQSSGTGNEKCADSVVIEGQTEQKCESLTLETYPTPVPPNESIEIMIKTTPENWSGSFFINTTSGRLQLTQADPAAHGVNTNTLITSLKNIIYNGGKSGEQIFVQVLGEGNKKCSQSITIKDATKEPHDNIQT